MSRASGRAGGAPGGTSGWVVGRVAGAPVVISPGWVLAALVLTLLFVPTVRSYAPGIGSGAYVVAGSFVLLLLGSVFLHELAHALVARRRGVVVQELAVTLLGGHTRFGGAAQDPRTSALVAVAGPLVNVALGVLAWVLSTVMPPGLPRLVVVAAAIANGFVGLFNLLPGLPLDGGRVLEALVWRVTGNRTRGSVVAGWIGRVVAVAVLGWVLLEPLARGGRPSLVGVVWGAMVGAFLWSGAAGSVRAARAEAALDRISVRALMRDAVGMPTGGTVADVAGAQGGDHDVVLVDASGRPVAWVDHAALAAVPPAVRGSTPAAAVAVPVPRDAVVAVHLTGREAVQAVAAATALSPTVVVTDPFGGVAGLLRAQTVVDALRATGTGRRAP